jgi:hypothetical protein
MPSNTPVPMADYANILKALPSAVGEMVSAFDRDEYGTAHETAEKIAAWYFPESDYYADRIAELIKQVFAGAYFSGAQEQIRKQNAARERSFEPPF